MEVGEALPHGGAEQETVQLTPMLLPPFTTVAVNCALVPTSTVALVLGMDTCTGGAEPPPQLKFPIARTAAAIHESTAPRLLADIHNLRPPAQRLGCMPARPFRRAARIPK